MPWKPATVRLDTYSGAPVDFAAYGVDVADVIVAGQQRAARALDTAHRKPLVRWRFSPPRGYRFQSSDVGIPLGTHEGFYVVEARRGDAVQQVWLNRTHIGLLTKESPEGIVVWGVDLRSGRAIANMDVSFLVGLQLVKRRTDRDGLIVWRDPARPTFALAEHGVGRAFVSTLPQAPLPASLVGLRVESAVARAGEPVRFVGFARKRSSGGYRRVAGDARVTLAGRGKTLAAVVTHVDGAGAFSGEIPIPPGTDAGDYAVLASVAGGVAGTSVRVDAQSDVSLAVRALCPCDPDRDVALALTARRGETAAADLPIRVQIVRTPHVVPPGSPDDAARWGTTIVYDRTIKSDVAGNARVTIASPSDGLDSTYGIRATMRGASATSRAVVPSAKLALALEPDAMSADVGVPVGFVVRGFDPSDGTPAADLPVKVRLSHGASLHVQDVALDAHGRGHVVFRETSLGSNLALAEAHVDGRTALDAAAVLVEPSALSGRTNSARGPVSVTTDKLRYRPGAAVVVNANAAGSSGDALLTLEGARTYAMRRADVAAGAATSTLALGEPQGAVRVTAAFVRDGAIALGSADVNIDGPGHARLTNVTLDKPTYDAGDTLHASIADGPLDTGATVAVRIADGRESGSAVFEDAPDLLGTGATTAQAPASDDPAWHAYVAPAHSKASDIFAAERPRRAATDVPTIGVAAPRTLFWRVARQSGATLDVAVPKQPGHYVLSILKISDDGDVGAASTSFNVQ